MESGSSSGTFWPCDLGRGSSAPHSLSSPASLKRGRSCSSVPGPRTGWAVVAAGTTAALLSLWGPPLPTSPPI